MKRVVKKALSKMVGGAGAAPIENRGRIQEVCDAMSVPRIEPMPLAEFQKVSSPLFPTPTPIPASFEWKAFPNAEAGAFNKSMQGYYQVDKTEDGAVTLFDAYENAWYWSRQRMILAAVQEMFGGSLEGKTMIDIGCSSGYYCFHADRLGAADVLGIDARPEHEEQFRLVHGMVHASERCHYRHVDMEFGLEQLSDTYDLVSAQGVMYHVFDHPRFCRNLYQLTRHGLILEGACSGRTDEYCRPMLENPKDLRESIHGPVLYPSLRWMIEVMRWAGFRDVRYINFPSDLPPSKHHDTLWRAMLIAVK